MAFKLETIAHARKRLKVPDFPKGHSFSEQLAYNRGYIAGLKQANKIWKESFRKAELKLS